MMPLFPIGDTTMADLSAPGIDAPKTEAFLRAWNGYTALKPAEVLAERGKK